MALSGAVAARTRGPGDSGGGEGGGRPEERRTDAYELADRHRRDALPRAVFKDAGRLTTLRQMVKVHASIVRDTVRVQNRIKAVLSLPRRERHGQKRVFPGRSQAVACDAPAEQPYLGRASVCAVR